MTIGYKSRQIDAPAARADDGTTGIIAPLHPPEDRSQGDQAIDLPRVTDYHDWAFRQAALLRTGRFDLVDLPNVIDEIEALGKAEFHSFRSNIKIVLTHILKWEFQPGKRSRSWATSVGNHRDRIEENLDDSPSLKARRDEAVDAAYVMARRKATRETGLPLSDFPEVCPYSWEQIMDASYELNRD